MRGRTSLFVLFFAFVFLLPRTRSANSGARELLQAAAPAVSPSASPALSPAASTGGGGCASPAHIGILKAAMTGQPAVQMLHRLEQLRG